MATRDEQSNNFLNSDALSDEFFIEIIEKKLGLKSDQFKVRLVLLSNATGKNENYVSAVYRAKINVEIFENKERKFIDVIIKAMLSNLPEIKEWSVFPREIFIYDNIISNFESIWKEKANEEIVFGPKCLKVANEPYEIIVLDDLTVENFQMLNRKVGVDLDQAKLVLSKLGKFHATGALMIQKEDEISEHLDRGTYKHLFTIESSFYPFYVKSLAALKNVVKTLDGFQEISKKLSKLTPEDVMFAYFEPMNATKSNFKVINHGDDWINNIMFKINENGITEDVRFLDYQVSYIGSPVGDLIYFIYLSVNDEVKTKNFNDFIQCYHYELEKSLKILNYDGKIPTLDEIYEEFYEKRKYGLSILLNVMFVCKYDGEDQLTMETFADPTILTEEIMTNYYQNKNYLDALKLWLKFFEEREFLDF
ncbi:hypothetical protein PVAND_005363 [Polypedilum vanderplanki]|uniref:CHK kinase-like domain-containing protein n=1 Tax=Polypedilum vanderplanki TaxID=319348 RepID=A0A9J6C0T4_POLVA|nr:hypothetical protein PVAND_005363 [Polypedilum vanderplanki]